MKNPMYLNQVIFRASQYHGNQTTRQQLPSNPHLLCHVCDVPLINITILLVIMEFA